MALSYAAADALFREGRFLELLRRFGHVGDAALLGPDVRALLGNALLCTGDLDGARHFVLANLSASVPAKVRARSEQVLGLVSRREGDLAASIRHFQHGVRLGQEATDLELTAWNQLHLFRTMTEGHSMDELSGLFSEVRKLVIRVADPHLLAFLHEAVALREAQAGRLTEAERHVRIGLSILETRPNAWLKQLLHMSSACIACLKCDFNKASSESKCARELGFITGENYQGPTIDLNDAHFELMMGRFGASLAKLNRLRSSPGIMVRLAALDCLGRLYLALNRLPECDEVFAEIAPRFTIEKISIGKVDAPGPVTRTRLAARRVPPVGCCWVCRRSGTDPGPGRRRMRRWRPPVDWR